MTPEQQQILSRHQAAQKALADAKDQEQSLRKQVVKAFSDPTRDKGRERVATDIGLELVITKKLNYKVLNDNGQVKHLEAIMPPEMFSDLFKVSYDISVSAYNKLTVAQKQVVDYALEITEGMPELKYEPIKTEKVI